MQAKRKRAKAKKRENKEELDETTRASHLVQRSRRCGTSCSWVQHRQHRTPCPVQHQAAGVEGAKGGSVAHAHTRDPCCCRCPHAVLLQGAVHGAGALIQQREHGALVQQAGEAQTLLLTTTADGQQGFDAHTKHGAASGYSRVSRWTKAEAARGRGEGGGGRPFTQPRLRCLLPSAISPEHSRPVSVQGHQLCRRRCKVRRASGGRARFTRWGSVGSSAMLLSQRLQQVAQVHGEQQLRMHSTTQRHIT